MAGFKQAWSGVFQRSSQRRRGRSATAASVRCEPLERRALLSGNGAGSTVLCTVVDEIGDTYLAGSFRGAVDFDPGPGVATLASRGRSDAFLLKLDAAGGLLWAKSFGSAGDDAVKGIALNPLGDDVLVVGHYSGTLAMDPTDPEAVLPGAGRRDGFIASFDSDGNDVWARSFGGSLMDGINAVAIARTGTVYVGGEFAGSVDFDLLNGGEMLTSTGRGGRTDGFVAAYSLLGDCLWARGVGGGKDDAVLGIAVDGNGMVVAVGDFQHVVDFDPGAGVVRSQSRGEEDGFVLALDTAGDYLWSFTFGDRGEDAARAVACDAAGNVFVGGEFERTVDFDPSSGRTSLRSAGEEDGFVAKYSAEGGFAWVRGFGSPKEDGIFAVALDPSGGVVAGGQRAEAVSETTWSRGRPQTRIRWRDAGYAVKLDDAGQTVWSASFLAAAVGSGANHDHDDDDDDDDDDKREERRRHCYASVRGD